MRALDTSPGNLRPAATSFIGRESEVAELQAAVKAHRLVTLTGVGGVGKTRLATEVAARLADEFPDGVWFFELAAVADPAAVPDAVAAVLGITQQPGKSVSESVAAALEGRVRLLVFDNCEHVLDAAADLVEAILAQSATVKILATSREGLGGRRRATVAGALAGRRRGNRLCRGELVRRTRPQRGPALLAGHARRGGRGGGDLPPPRRDPVGHRAGGLTDGVDDRRARCAIVSISGSGCWSAPGAAWHRHHTLRHAVAWSYDHLDDAEKALLERCSVFAGGFDLQSACAVAGFDDVDDFAVLDLLDALVRKSLLVADRSAGRTRFSMLETIRQFAEEQLVARGEAAEVRAAHARHFAGREADILALWDSPRQREAYDWFTVELANLRTAFRWAADHGDLDVAAAIATYAAFLGTLCRKLRADSLGRRAHRTRPRRRPSPARGPVRDGVAVLPDRTDRGGCPLQRRGQMAIAQWPRRGAVRLSRAGLAVRTCSSASPNGRSSGAAPSSHAVATLTHSPGHRLVLALTIAGSADEAMAAATGLIDAAEATRNPYALSFALLAYGFAFRDADPDRAL